MKRDADIGMRVKLYSKGSGRGKGRRSEDKFGLTTRTREVIGDWKRQAA